jgi:hypothetical protein
VLEIYMFAVIVNVPVGCSFNELHRSTDATLRHAEQAAGCFTPRDSKFRGVVATWNAVLDFHEMKRW